MDESADWIAAAGHRSAMDRLTALADLDLVHSRRGPGLLAVRSGVMSNDLNGVVSRAGAVPGPDVVSELLGWLGGVPASWLAEAPDPALTAVLLAAGLVPERTGNWCARRLDGPWPGPVTPPLASRSDLEDWLDVAQTCGWFADGDDRGRRRRLAIAGDGQSRWVARREGRAVAMASGRLVGALVELVDIAVLPAERRRGVGKTLVGAVLGWAATQGARHAVAAPSPDGWRLLESLDHTLVPVRRDVCFYLPPP